MTKNTTKRALVSSILVLVLCFTMLLGTTFAWFTDSASSVGNKITTGNLDVDLYLWDTEGSTEITNSSAPIFPETIIWEPGMTQVVYLSIKNNGSLALKYKVGIEVKNVTKNLDEVMSYAITPDATVGAVNAWANNGTPVSLGTNVAANDVVLNAGAEHFFALSVHMDEEAGNEYMNGTIEFDINVLAGQLAFEEDSFGPNYDKNASYPGTGYADPIPAGGSAAEIEIRNTNEDKVGSIVIPAAAASGEAFSASITKSAYKGNFTIASGLETTVYDVTVTGLKDGNTEPVKVQLRIPAGLDPNTVKLYHYDNLIASNYNPNTGYVTFETATFSPFTVVYDAESEYVAPEVNDTMARPTAKVEYLSQYVGADANIEWGNYGSWSPTEGLEAVLEAAFKFSCPTDLDPEIEAAFENWYCDFYVMLDKDLGENELFLGGNYGTFGWVGFHNGDVTLEANQEIGLLESVTTNPWTYADVRDFVGEFICGVGDVDGALEGATFTVMLRLTNPDDETEYYNVNVVTYTFGGNYNIDGVVGVTTAEGLKDALENGDDEQNVQLGGDIDLNDLLNGLN